MLLKVSISVCHVDLENEVSKTLPNHIPLNGNDDQINLATVFQVFENTAINEFKISVVLVS